MGAGTKILAGCGCVAILTATVVVAGLGLGLFWLKDKAYDLTDGLEAITARTREIEAWEREANAHPYERRSDGVVPEPRLKAFLDVRRRVHEVYEGYRDDLEELREQAEGRRTPPSSAAFLALGARAAEMFGDLRLVQVRALAEVGMSEAEYYAIQTAVYLAAGASKTESETGHLPAEAPPEAARQAQEALRAAVEAARQRGLPGTEVIQESDLTALEEALAKAGADGAEALAVPPANVELFRKYEADLEKYAMHGLALLGL
jgi:hypothetical protein